MKDSVFKRLQDIIIEKKDVPILELMDYIVNHKWYRHYFKSVVNIVWTESCLRAEFKFITTSEKIVALEILYFINNFYNNLIHSEVKIENGECPLCYEKMLRCDKYPKTDESEMLREIEITELLFHLGFKLKPCGHIFRNIKFVK